MRADVRTNSSGVLLVSLAHTPSAFSPYRIDNCTCEPLHIQQVGPGG